MNGTLLAHLELDGNANNLLCSVPGLAVNP